MTNIINVNLDNLVNNFQYFYNNFEEKNIKIFPVVKGNAYNIGCSIVVKILNEKFNCRDFFVYSLDEAVYLKNIFKDFNFYSLGGIKLNQEKIFFDNKITPIVNSIKQLKRYSIFHNSDVILQFNSGMNRNGINIHEIENALDIIGKSKLKVKFIMSHLACADDRNNPMTIQQLNNFKIISNYFPGVEKSIAATDGIINIEDDNLYDIVRVGGGLYGFNYSDKLDNVLSLLSQIKKKNNLYYINLGRNNGIFKYFEKNGFVLYKNKKIMIKRVLNNKIILDTNKKHLKNKFCLICGKDKECFIDINIFSKNMGLIPYEAQVRLLENVKSRKNFKINYFYDNKKCNYKFDQIPVIYENKNVVSDEKIISSIIEIRTIYEEGWVGYGAKYKVKKGDIIATFDIGYINGISRNVINKCVFVQANNGKYEKCKIIGNISMDQTTILLNSDNFSIGNKIIVCKNKKYYRKYKDIFFMSRNRNKKE